MQFYSEFLENKVERRLEEYLNNRCLYSSFVNSVDDEVLLADHVSDRKAGNRNNIQDRSLQQVDFL